MVERAGVLKTGDIITKKNLQDALYPPDLDMAAESGAAFMAAAGQGACKRTGKAAAGPGTVQWQPHQGGQASWHGPVNLMEENAEIPDVTV